MHGSCIRADGSIVVFDRAAHLQIILATAETAGHGFPTSCMATAGFLPISQVMSPIASARHIAFPTTKLGHLLVPCKTEYQVEYTTKTLVPTISPASARTVSFSAAVDYDSNVALHPKKYTCPAQRPLNSYFGIYNRCGYLLPNNKVPIRCFTQT